jgi:hypothetical protein
MLPLAVTVVTAVTVVLAHAAGAAANADNYSYVYTEGFAPAGNDVRA